MTACLTEITLILNDPVRPALFGIAFIYCITRIVGIEQARQACIVETCSDMAWHSANRAYEYVRAGVHIM